jgi:hypothetical protein
MAVDLNEHDIEVSAALLKVFIRDLPAPLIGLKFSESMGALPGKINLKMKKKKKKKKGTNALYYKKKKKKKRC